MRSPWTGSTTRSGPWPGGTHPSGGSPRTAPGGPSGSPSPTCATDSGPARRMASVVVLRGRRDRPRAATRRHRRRRRQRRAGRRRAGDRRVPGACPACPAHRAGLCHGLAGLYMTAMRAAHDARSPDIAARLPAAAVLLAGKAGPPRAAACSPDQPEPGWPWNRPATGRRDRDGTHAC